MKRKFEIRGIYVVAFLVLSVLTFAADSALAQCGNYFKTNYRAINKLVVQFSSETYLDDWTGDGKSDLWNFQWNGSSAYNVVIYPSRSAGYWDWNNPITYTTPIDNLNNGAALQFVTDFDSDGRKDLFFFRGEYRIYRNTGNGSLAASPVTTDPDATASPIGFADVNGDNRLDWIYAVGFGSFPNQTFEIRYKLQNADGSFGSNVTIHTSTISSNKRLGDFNGDGRKDIIYSGVVNNQHVYVLIKNLGGGVFQADPPVATDLYVFIPPIDRNPVRDFNNDGKDDILSRDAVFFGQTDGTFNRVGITTNNDFLLAAELNGDTNPDIMEVGTGYYATHLNNGAGGFTRIEYQREFETRGSLRFEDFSGDGKDDIYEPRVPITSSDFINSIFGESLLSVRENVCQPAGETSLANFDGSTPDLVSWNPASGVWSSKNARWFTTVSPNTKIFNWGSGSLGDVPAPGDYDADGITDYAVYRDSTGVWYIFKSSDSSWLTVPFGLAGDIAVPNDYDGGGKTDIAVWRPSTGVWYFWFTETQTFGAVHFGSNGDKPVAADYDGDGKTDVAVYRPSEGKWYYLKSSDLTYVVLNWGTATDIPLPADYDGDGRADLTIYRDGFWWIWRSSNNSYAVVQWGQAGDVPMPVYRNSLSADLVLYRPSNNSWYSFNYRFAAGVTLGASGDVPVRFGLPNN